VTHLVLQVELNTLDGGSDGLKHNNGRSNWVRKGKGGGKTRGDHSKPDLRTLETAAETPPIRKFTTNSEADSCFLAGLAADISVRVTDLSRNRRVIFTHVNSRRPDLFSCAEQPKFGARSPKTERCLLCRSDRRYRYHEGSIFGKPICSIRNIQFRLFSRGALPTKSI
jgi:hypothetical protein